MRENHLYRIEGGEYLTTLGSSWFVSYSYYLKIDSTHKNWNMVTTTYNRIRNYKISTQYHELWLEKILYMNDANLNKNSLGLSAKTVKEMAKKLLEQYN
ncbi:MAG: hypothetical protein IKA85_04025 [Clostridia bacterium]|nr:hypothetical protein [Clostridia bacterium]